MTLQEAKDQIAQLYGHKNWRDFRSDGMDWRVYETAHEEVAELYARSKCEEAIYAYLSYPQNSLLDINKVLPQILRYLFEEQDI